MYVVAQIAQEKAEIEKERKKLIKLYKEHKELEKTQLEEKQQVHNNYSYTNMTALY